MVNKDKGTECADSPAVLLGLRGLRGALLGSRLDLEFRGDHNRGLVAK